VTKTRVPTKTPYVRCADVNNDNRVTVKDLVLVAKYMGKKQGQWGYNPKYDLNSDRRVNVKDLLIVLHQLGRRC
jgi:hypothetical protein